MKPIKFRTTIILFCVSFSLICCSNDKMDDPKPTVVKIEKELPKMYLDVKDNFIIQTQEELEKTISDEKMNAYPELSEINFSQQTLLLGYGKHPYKVQIKHRITQKDSHTFQYCIGIGGMPAAIDYFNYGVIINKITDDISILFEIKDLDFEDLEEYDFDF